MGLGAVKMGVVRGMVVCVLSVTLNIIIIVIFKNLNFIDIS